ncbi:chymotrypsin-like protease CTRL-1 [Centruroides sculpturatus]|uniref:chymotrypsin-like protease CTRL-1 n=1 Tax=Centruroides sculpturatus TaxID=218467 RepID=UPI000C6CE9CC|nr:chymotrypsin-like protease CTRL-1 [Centruroides sculpturatus]
MYYRFRKRAAIVDGTHAGLDVYHFVARIYYKKQGMCGATVITDSHLLTAAHCLYGMEKNLKEMCLLINAYDTSQNEGDQEARNICNVRLHPRYDCNNYDNDIAIVNFEPPLSLGSRLRAISLPPPNFYFTEGLTVIAWGWGGKTPDDTGVDTLQEARLSIISENSCKRYFLITSDNICAKRKDGNACHGDSGGSVLLEHYNYYIACGVISRGYKCGGLNTPDIYTNVAKYVTWIYENTKDAGCKPNILFDL